MMLHKIIWPPSRGVGDGILRNNATVPSVKTYAWGWGYGDIRDAMGFSRDGNRGCRTPTRMEQRLGDSRGDVKEMNGSVKEPNMFHNYEMRKSLVKPVTRQKTCNYIELFGSSARDRYARRRI